MFRQTYAEATDDPGLKKKHLVSKNHTRRDHGCPALGEVGCSDAFVLNVFARILPRIEVAKCLKAEGLRALAKLATMPVREHGGWIVLLPRRASQMHVEFAEG